MYTQEEYENNPLHGTSLEQVLTQMVDHYGWEILAAYLNLNCFKQNPSIKASLKFLKKTEWAQHKVESFYLYQFKNLPRADDAMFELPPRDRIVPLHQKPKEPQELSLEDAERLRLKREKAARNKDSRHHGDDRSRSRQSKTSHSPYEKTAQKSETSNDPYANFKSKG
ncbi:VF530 family protein [Thalassotalea litorea]|uniref:VF530 family protein n=1 Tax=Thalassotalea litorea TaxID=2020715 RepID=UPI00373691C0